MNTSKTTMLSNASVEEPGPSVITRTRNGKIARLPLEIREQLNRRLADAEQGKSLVEWLNSLPEVQAVMKAAFDGAPVREQNLSEWKQGGYREWQKQQERREIVRQWAEDAKELESAAGDAGFSSSLSMILLAELAQALTDVLEENTDAGTRLERLLEVARRTCQLRREESNAKRVQVAREDCDAAHAPLHPLVQYEYFKNMLGNSADLVRENFARSLEGELDRAMSRASAENPIQSK
jgi:hypothetical protein